MTFPIGSMVFTTEHPKSIGQVMRSNEAGDLFIEFRTPRSESLLYGHIITEFWPVSDQHLLSLIEV
jgi:hypothetical protein